MSLALRRSAIVPLARAVRPVPAVAALLLASGCKIQDDASFRRATADRLPAAASSARAEPEGAEGAIPEGPMGASIRRGRAIMLATRDSLPRNVGNALRCVSCHLDEGSRPYAMPWTGVMARYPQYRSRSGQVETVEDRVNECFRRSLAGSALPVDGPAMRDIVAYLAHLSRGVPVGTRVTGQGIDSVKAAARGDTANGRAVFAAQCARCHGPNGEGSVLAPPTWGRKSFTIGAGMARWRVTAAFVRHNMPNDRRESLSDQEAIDVASYITSRPRPDLRGKELDWPRGNAPDDAAYATKGASGSRNARASRR
ncbi:MAG: c-type cytochrome [Gemmatimonadetes bacterium]|nr:c-type cytochrome [Gemmatimonadota bacterium]